MQQLVGGQDENNIIPGDQLVDDKSSDVPCTDRDPIHCQNQQQSVSSFIRHFKFEQSKQQQCDQEDNIRRSTLPMLGVLEDGSEDRERPAAIGNTRLVNKCFMPRFLFSYQFIFFIDL